MGPLTAPMPHESATAALKTVWFPGGPFHDTAPEEDVRGSRVGLQAAPLDVTPWTYRVIVGE